MAFGIRRVLISVGFFLLSATWVCAQIEGNVPVNGVNQATGVGIGLAMGEGTFQGLDSDPFLSMVTGGLMSGLSFFQGQSRAAIAPTVGVPLAQYMEQGSVLLGQNADLFFPFDGLAGAGAFQDLVWAFPPGAPAIAHAHIDIDIGGLFETELYGVCGVDVDFLAQIFVDMNGNDFSMNGFYFAGQQGLVTLVNEPASGGFFFAVGPAPRWQRVAGSVNSLFGGVNAFQRSSCLVYAP